MSNVPAPTPTPATSPVAAVAAIAKKANTHRVGLWGLFVGAGAIAAHVAAALIAGGQIHASIGVQLVASTLDTYVVSPALAGGVVAAYLGMPKTIPSAPP